MVRRSSALLGSCLALSLALPLAGAQAAPADRRTIYGVTSNGNRLVSFPANSPGSAAPVGGGAITGLGAGERIVGIDVRPSNGLLYALTSDGPRSTSQSTKGTGRLYTLDRTTATATPVAGAATLALRGAFFDADFNPVADALRVVSSAGQNLRVTGADLSTAITDGNLSYRGGDSNAGKPPRVGGIAYTPTASDNTTQLYDADYLADALSQQTPANDGTLTTIGPLGFNVTNLLGFDIETDGTGYVTAQTLAGGGVSSATELFTVDLATGALTSVGTVEGDILDSIAISTATAGPGPQVPELPLALLAPLVAVGLGGAVVLRRRAPA